MLFGCALSMLGTLGFLVQEGRPARVAAFSSWWTLKFNLASWFIFLIILLAAPISFFVDVDSRALCEAMRWIGSLLMATCGACQDSCRPE
jgi:hypothetical protein